MIHVPNQKFCYHFGSFIPYSDYFSLKQSQQLDWMILKISEIKLQSKNLKGKQYSDIATKATVKSYFLWQTLTGMVTPYTCYWIFLTIFAMVRLYLIITERSQNPGNLKNWGFFAFFHYLQMCVLNNVLLSNEFLKTWKKKKTWKVKLHLPKKAPKDTLPIPVS